jgi:2'-5' RNA ligase
MISFKQYLLESTPGGNYLSIGVEAPGISLRALPYGIPDDGYECEPGNQHVTLIYSEASKIDPTDLLSEVTAKFPQSLLAEIDHFECFDALPKDGERDENKCTIVAKLYCPMLREIHDYLVSRGCRHSYDEYSPHMSLWYDCDRAKGHELADKLNKYYQVPSLVLQYYKSDTIKKDWAKTQD